MRVYNTTFPEFRQIFKSQMDIAQVINKSRSYVDSRMNKRKEWTDNDLKLIRAEIERRQAI